MAAFAALGAFSALAGAPPAAQAATAPLTVDLTYVATPAEDGIVLEIFATNTGSAKVAVDDNPVVRTARLVVDGATFAALSPPPDVEMFSRMGPRRTWITLQPGERLLVGTTTIPVSGGVPAGAQLEVVTALLAPGASAIQQDTVSFASLAS